MYQLRQLASSGVVNSKAENAMGRVITTCILVEEDLKSTLT